MTGRIEVRPVHLEQCRPDRNLVGLMGFASLNPSYRLAPQSTRSNHYLLARFIRPTCFDCAVVLVLVKDAARRFAVAFGDP